MSKDIDLKQLNNLGKSSLGVIQRYIGFAFIIIVLFTYAFLVLRISTLSQKEPTDDQIAEKSSSVKRLKIDQSSISKIQELEDQSIEIKSIFKDARDNPFQEN